MMMSARQMGFREVMPREAPEPKVTAPVADLLARALAYRDCERELEDPLGVSVLSLFAMLHRLHADQLLPHLTAVMAIEPDRSLDLVRMRLAVARDGHRWLDEFLASERKLKLLYKAAIAATETATAREVNRLLHRQQAVLHERLAEVFAEMGQHLAPFLEPMAENPPPRKGD
jgi:hypothetical protein